MNFLIGASFFLVSFFAVFNAFGAGGGESHGVTPTQIKNLIWWSVNFLVLVILLYKLLKKPVVNFFKARQEGLLRQYEELLAKKKEAEARYLELHERVKNLKKEAEEIYQSYVEQGIKEKERILEEAKKQAERLREQARLYISQEMEKAKDQLREELAREAVKLAEEILRREIKPEDHKNLYRNFLEQIRGGRLN